VSGSASVHGSCATNRGRYRSATCSIAHIRGGIKARENDGLSLERVNDDKVPDCRSSVELAYHNESKGLDPYSPSCSCSVIPKAEGIGVLELNTGVINSMSQIATESQSIIVHVCGRTPSTSGVETKRHLLYGGRCYDGHNNWIIATTSVTEGIHAEHSIANYSNSPKYSQRDPSRARAI